MKTLIFGPYTWRILDERDGKALLLCEDIIERCAYNDALAHVTWETCTLRKHLNGEFLEGFSLEERARIALARNDNPDNTWGRMQGEPFNTPGGNPTEDYAFLLNVEEVLKYYPGLKLRKDCDGDEWWYESDDRLVSKHNGEAVWWWLRSPGYSQNHAAYVSCDGDVDLYGTHVRRETGGARPALWLNLESDESSNPCESCLNFNGNSAWCGGCPEADKVTCKMFQPLKGGLPCSVVVWHETAVELPQWKGNPKRYYCYYRRGDEHVFCWLVKDKHGIFWVKGPHKNVAVLTPDFWAELPALPKGA